MKNTILLLGVLIAGVAHADDKWDVSHLDATKLPPASDKKDLTFAKDIKPLFEASCLKCHGGERHKGGLRLDTLEGVLKGGDDGVAVVPKESAKSLLVFAAAQVNDEVAMPPKHHGGGPGGPGGNHGDHHPSEGDKKGPGGGAPPAGGPGGKFGPPAKPFSKDEVALVRAWIDQGAK